MPPRDKVVPFILTPTLRHLLTAAKTTLSANDREFAGELKEIYWRSQVCRRAVSRFYHYLERYGAQEVQQDWWLRALRVYEEHRAYGRKNGISVGIKMNATGKEELDLIGGIIEYSPVYDLVAIKGTGGIRLSRAELLVFALVFCIQPPKTAVKAAEREKDDLSTGSE